MTLKQVLTFDVNRILRFDVNRILLWDVGRALRQPVRSPLLKAACGYYVCLLVFGLGSIVVGIRASDAVIFWLAIALGVAFAIVPDPSFTQGGKNTKAEGPGV
jgi:hypothetical protein